MRIGIGYDAHRLVEGRPLILGGVNIPFELGLEGWSDADVVLHAVMDALLGAAGLGDIGKYFPPDDPAYRGIASLSLLERVREALRNEGWQVGNIDVAIVAERPHLRQAAEQIKENIGKALSISKDQVGIKATTSEGMGFVGRMEGIAAYSVALIEKL